MNAHSSKESLAAATVTDRRWHAVVTHDRAADGEFVYSVKSTGVYCRPSCAARTPRPENVAFHATPAEARSAGFRPCKRCRPDGRSLHEQRAAKIARACRQLEQSDEAPPLKELAAAAGMSAFHFHRLFKRITGITPKAYAAAARTKRMKAALQTSPSVTDAIYLAGFSSNSRFYDKATSVLGMTPSEYRAGGADTEIRFAVGECALGSILVAQSARGICAISLGDDPAELVRDLQDRFANAELVGADEAFEALVAKVVGFVEDPRIGLGLPLDIRGTAFQQRVWQALTRIQPGRTVSYAELARQLGVPNAVRAVASACARNALAVAIPCHRVVRSDGGVYGYRWGVERKRALLKSEKSG